MKIKNPGRRIFAWLLALFLCFSSFEFHGLAQEAEDMPLAGKGAYITAAQNAPATITLPSNSTTAELQTAINAAESGDIIAISSDMIFESPVTIPAESEITIQSDADNSQSLRCISSDTRHFTVLGTLLLQNITLDGGGAGGGVEVQGDGHLTIDGGAVIQNCYAVDGGGVYIAGGSATIAGGSVIKNTAAGSGGGIYAVAGTLLTMEGGSVSQNSALPPVGDALREGTSGYGGGICTRGTFIMHDGLISENVLEAYTSFASTHNANPTSLQGAGVNATYMEMHGGEISHNRLTGSAAAGQSGGGIYVGATLLITGGEVSYNKIQTVENGRHASGGGIYGGIITMQGGRIHHNDVGTAPAGSKGGGIMFSRLDWLKMSGGEVYANSAQWGAGIYAYTIDQHEQCSITGDARIYDNVGIYGGGITIYSEHPYRPMTVQISDNVEIFNNKATSVGGGVFVYAYIPANAEYEYLFLSAIITDNAAIYGNEAGTYGGGVAIRSYGAGNNNITGPVGQLTIAGDAMIYDNISPTAGGILVWNSDLLLQDRAHIFDNIATGTDGGAGIRHSAGTYDTMHITDQVRITGNRAENGYGGGIYTSVWRALTIDADVVFEGNVASKGCFWTVDPEASDPSDDADGTHNAHIHTTHFTTPFTNAYNNFDINFIASPEDPYYSVTYDPNGGSGTTPAIGAKAGGEFAASENAFTAPEGTQFKAWNMQSDGLGESYLPGATVPMPEQPLILYAMWEDVFALTVQANAGGQVDSAANGSYPAGWEITIKAIADRGYRFRGWISEHDDGIAHVSSASTTFTMPSEAVTLTADFQPVSSTYTIAYYPNGGTGDRHEIGDNPYGNEHTVLKEDDPALGYHYIGHTFSGWNLSADGSGNAYMPGDTIAITDNITLYAQWIRIDAEPEVPDDSYLDKENHLAYMIGFIDGTIRPESNITRAEVATIFFRLLNEDARADMWSNINRYSDVTAESWCNTAISTLTSGGILNGCPDGTFAPTAPITRAEFAAIAARFAAGVSDSGFDNDFSDISGHWAERAIKQAAGMGYVEGYGDGTFHPDAPMTRAEVAVLLNRVLQRSSQLQDPPLDGMVTWPDNTPDKWYYSAIQEATNSHYYTRTDGGADEIWISIRETPDYAVRESAGAV